MRNVQGASLNRYKKVRMAFNLSLKLFNLSLKLFNLWLKLQKTSSLLFYRLHVSENQAKNFW